jgi:8-oxo-dGTP pyrophosphatase MutT (NUDIX family)
VPRELTTKERIIQALTPIVLPIVRAYWFLFVPDTYGVKVVLEKNDKILLVRHTYGSGDWTFPGGSIENDEVPKDAARREIIEELGIHISDIAVCDTFVSTHEYKRDHITVCFTVVDTHIHADPFEIAEADWYQPDNIPDLHPVGEQIFSIFKDSYNEFQ